MLLLIWLLKWEETVNSPGFFFRNDFKRLIHFYRKGERYVDPKTHVIILGYTDLPSRMSQQSSELFATNMYNLFEELCTIPKNSCNSLILFFSPSFFK